MPVVAILRERLEAVPGLYSDGECYYDLCPAVPLLSNFERVYFVSGRYGRAHFYSAARELHRLRWLSTLLDRAFEPLRRVALEEGATSCP